MPIHKFPLKAITCATRAGFLTKEIWRKYLFEGKSIRGCNKGWMELVRRGYFAHHPNERMRDVLVLNRQSRKLMAGFDEPPAKPPMERQLHHDEILLGGVLDLERQGFLSHWTTEAELKSLGLEAYRLSTSLMDAKYADAILYLSGLPGHNKVAVELELTLKEKGRYRQIMSSYSFVRELRLLLFVVANPAIEAAIRTAAEEVFFPKESTTIAFMRVGDWKRNPVDAPMDIDEHMDRRKITFASWVAGRTQSHAA